MKTPAQMIASLDRQLAKAGSSAVLRRYPDKVNNPDTKTDVTLMASTRVKMSDQLVGAIDQSAKSAVISPTEIAADSWPLPIRKGDKLVLSGREANIELATPIKVLGTVVRYDLVIKG